MTRYYSNFPALPTALVSAISAISGISSIVDAKACCDGSLILEIFHDENYQPTLDQLTAAADVVECPAEDVFIESLDDETLVVTFLTSEHDFAYLFPASPSVITDPPPNHPQLTRFEGPDSEEIIQALEGLLNFRNT